MCGFCTSNFAGEPSEQSTGCPAGAGFKAAVILEEEMLHKNVLSEVTGAKRRNIERGECVSVPGRRYCQTAHKIRGMWCNVAKEHKQKRVDVGARKEEPSPNRSFFGKWTFPGYKTVCNHQSGRCRLVPGVDKGSEDIQVLPNGLAFITSDKDPQIPGNIFLFDFKKPRQGVQVLDIVGDLDRSTFSPIGLNIWRDNCNVIYIFVANAIGNGEETVQKFRFDENRRKLYLVRTYRDPTFTHPNDIAVTGEDSFYFTNLFQFDFKEEFLRGLSIGDAGFFDGTRGHILLTGLSSPNGINISPDGKYVYMSELAGKRLNVYHRESDNTLTRTQVVPLEILVDNIDVDVVTGHLWVAGRTDGQALLNHMQPPHKAISPSLALRLTLSEDSKVKDIAEVYYGDGRQLSGASVAVHYRRHMLVGSVFTKLVLCEVHHA
ncbi:Serum paraoxonase/arylesterase 1 [Lamellibrachia satsuma]|nr:Serum paraoxonase/arylesterase 1 [Lamellibrachia satsuma]